MTTGKDRKGRKPQHGTKKPIKHDAINEPVSGVDPVVMKMKKTKVAFNASEAKPSEQDPENIFTNPDFDTFPGTDFLEKLESQRSEIVSQSNEMELDEEKDKYFESLANMETLIKITTPKKKQVSTRTPRFEDQDTPLFMAEVKHVQGQILLNFLVVMYSLS